MKVELEVYKEVPKEEPTTKITLALAEEDNGVMTVRDTTTGKYLVGFKLVGGKLSFTRYGSVSGSQFNLNADGQLEEITEF